MKDPLRRVGKRRFEELSWDDALDQAEALLRSGPVLLALSGSETVEQAEALSRLVREGLGSDAVVLPEQASPALDAFRAPLSSIGKAERVIVIGDDPVEARAPVVGLWIKAARRNGAEIVTVGAAGTRPTAPGGAAEAVRALGEQARGAVLIWSGPGGAGGAVVAALAQELGAASAFYLPATPNGRAVVEAWGEGEPRGRRRSARCSSPATMPPPTRMSGSWPSGGRGDRDRDVRRPGARVGRPRPAGNELPRARRDDGQPRGPSAAPAPGGDPARAGRGRLDREARPSASAS